MNDTPASAAFATDNQSAEQRRDLRRWAIEQAISVNAYAANTTVASVIAEANQIYRYVQNGTVEQSKLGRHYSGLMGEAFGHASNSTGPFAKGHVESSAAFDSRLAAEMAAKRAQAELDKSPTTSQPEPITVFLCGLR